ncbi:hypothetical protein B0H13DRAFT_2323848 [Mycena leptocephala]|nr:hypothetical protein B0H13DRAFT_2323848 [Mycena leptocephala]
MRMGRGNGSTVCGSILSASSSSAYPSPAQHLTGPRDTKRRPANPRSALRILRAPDVPRCAWNAPPPAHRSAHDEHPHPGCRRGGGCRLLTGQTLLLPIRLPILTRPTTATAADTSAHITALLSSQPPTLVRATLKTSRPSPQGFDVFLALAQERGCLVDGFAGVWRDFAPFWRVEMGCCPA